MMPEVGLPNDVIVICPQTGIIAGRLLGLLTGHLRCICVSRQVIHKCLLSCSKLVMYGGVRAERCFHIPPLPAVWITLVTWKGLLPSCSQFMGPSTYSLYHHVLSMRRECGCPCCGAWPPCWRPFISNECQDLSKIVSIASPAHPAHMLWVCFCSLILQCVSGSALQSERCELLGMPRQECAL